MDPATWTKIAEVIAQYGPAALEALVWLGKALARWLSGDRSEEVLRVADVLPAHLRLRAEREANEADIDAIQAASGLPE